MSLNININNTLKTFSCKKDISPNYIYHYFDELKPMDNVPEKYREMLGLNCYHLFQFVSENTYNVDEEYLNQFAEALMDITYRIYSNESFNGTLIIYDTLISLMKKHSIHSLFYLMDKETESMFKPIADVNTYSVLMKYIVKGNNEEFFKTMYNIDNFKDRLFTLISISYISFFCKSKEDKGNDSNANSDYANEL